MEVQATLHDSQDLDYYELHVLDAPTAIIAQAPGGLGDRFLYLAYLCSDGKSGLGECSGWEEEIEGTKYCISEGEPIVIQRECSSGPSGGTESVGTVRVVVAAQQFGGKCDPYELQVLATYQLGLPGPF